MNEKYWCMYCGQILEDPAFSMDGFYFCSVEHYEVCLGINSEGGDCDSGGQSEDD